MFQDMLCASTGVWLHGEAVSAGMVMAADMSFRLGWIQQDILDRTRKLLQRAHLPVEPPQVGCVHRHALHTSLTTSVVGKHVRAGNLLPKLIQVVLDHQALP